ncbi:MULTISPECIES: L,D-transpeptidase [Streptomyces]|uniref:L,D-transpeptidase n=1 Tax=Streptomyces TaxID=1883 RepID=UPI0007C7E35B|nr:MULTISPECIES: L,D-transpeptidase [Streptomyces]MCF3122586.1 L,D-transpeptidase [Streptomyces arenae]
MDRHIDTADDGGRGRTGLWPGRRAAYAVTAAGLALAFSVTSLPAEAASAQAPARCRAGTGPYQWQLEKHLKLKQDGVQSEADCRAIQAFQQRHRVRPATGQANLHTYRMLLIVQAGKAPNKARHCPQRSYRVVCVDRTRQLLWVQQGAKGKLVMRPAPIRTGARGVETRGGMHRVFRRVRHDYSRIFNNARMPYSQYFSGGQALHGTYGDIYDGGGSHGCVNLRLKDASWLWRKVGKGNRVYVFGRKAGTLPRAAVTDDELIATTKWGYLDGAGGQGEPVAW